MVDFKYLYAGKIWHRMGFISEISVLILLTEYTVSHPKTLFNKKVFSRKKLTIQQKKSVCKKSYELTFIPYIYKI